LGRNREIEFFRAAIPRADLSRSAGVGDVVLRTFLQSARREDATRLFATGEFEPLRSCQLDDVGSRCLGDSAIPLRDPASASADGGAGSRVKPDGPAVVRCGPFRRGAGIALAKCVASPEPRAAEEAGLRYVRGDGPCIRRIHHGHSFRYAGINGRPLHDATHLKRVRSLVIPPAWEDVWICPSANGRLQAVGRDARGRNQYRYHPRYRAHRDEAKFSRMIAFGAVLARIRARVERDLRRHGLPREKVLATVVEVAGYHIYSRRQQGKSGQKRL
jgi:hypothetical protein